MSVTVDCSKECESTARCERCGRTKAPLGRSVAPEMHGLLCDDDCAGYRSDPWPGHLWPGEFARSKETE